MRALRTKIRQWLGVSGVEQRININENRLGVIENLVQVGVDLNFKTPSWIVVCLRGKNDKDVVRFFELPAGEIARLFEELKYLEKEFHIHPVFDAPSYIKKDYFRF